MFSSDNRYKKSLKCPGSSICDYLPKSTGQEILTIFLDRYVLLFPALPASDHLVCLSSFHSSSFGGLSCRNFVNDLVNVVPGFKER